MNKFYVIVPVVLLGVFAFFYNGATKEMAQKEANRIAKIKAKEDEEKTRKDAIEKKAQAEALERQQKREADDKAKEAKKEKDYQDAMAALKREADDYASQTTKLTKEASDMEAEILRVRDTKERLARESLELSKQVELAKINRRTAELEIQRMIDMVGRKLNESSIATPPPPPPLAPAK